MIPNLSMNSNEKNAVSIHDEIATYYADKLAQYGQTPLGVDWNGLESQTMRFEQLTKILPKYDGFSLNDLGSGYGALFEYLKDKYPNYTYLGIDVSNEMTSAAKDLYLKTLNARFITAAAPDQISDYGVASGIFNVRQGRSNSEWHEYLQNTLDVLNETSSNGFAFNCLTSYSDPQKMVKTLFYANPCELFDLCKRRYSKQVALLHDYGLYEFTILVRKIL